jgi:hypothetical protein
MNNISMSTNHITATVQSNVGHVPVHKQWNREWQLFSWGFPT